MEACCIVGLTKRTVDSARSRKKLFTKADLDTKYKNDGVQATASKCTHCRSRPHLGAGVGGLADVYS